MAPSHSESLFQGPFYIWPSSAFQDAASAYHLLKQKVVKPQGHLATPFPLTLQKPLVTS